MSVFSAQQLQFIRQRCEMAKRQLELNPDECAPRRTRTDDRWNKQADVDQRGTKADRSISYIFT